LASKRGATLFIGAAGTGKTTALRDRAVALLGAGEPGVLLLVHNRRAARALGDAIVRALGCSTGEVRVATWHALALGLLRAGYDALGYARPPALLSAPEQFALVREMLGTEEERARWRAFPKQVRLAGFAAELHEFVLRAQDAVLSPEELEERAGPSLPRPPGSSADTSTSSTSETWSITPTRSCRRRTCWSATVRRSQARATSGTCSPTTTRT